MADEINKFIISVDSAERVDEILKYLEKKSAPIVGTGKNTSTINPWIIAILPISMVREISELEGVVRVREVEQSAPGSSNQRTQPQPYDQSLVAQHEVHT